MLTPLRRFFLLFTNPAHHSCAQDADFHRVGSTHFNAACALHRLPLLPGTTTPLPRLPTLLPPFFSFMPFLPLPLFLPLLCSGTGSTACLPAAPRCLPTPATTSHAAWHAFLSGSLLSLSVPHLATLRPAPTARRTPRLHRAFTILPVSCLLPLAYLFCLYTLFCRFTTTSPHACLHAVLPAVLPAAHAPCRTAWTRATTCPTPYRRLLAARRAPRMLLTNRRHSTCSFMAEGGSCAWPLPHARHCLLLRDAWPPTPHFAHTAYARSLPLSEGDFSLKNDRTPPEQAFTHSKVLGPSITFCLLLLRTLGLLRSLVWWAWIHTH